MAFSFTLPFYAFRLRFPAKDYTVLKPLTEPDVVQVGESLHKLASRYRDAFQKELLNPGYPGALMDLSHYSQFLRDALSVSFPASKDGVSYPAFTLDVDFFYSEKNGKWWAIAPVTGVEAAADSQELLYKILSDNTKIYFSRTRRLEAVQGIVSVIWYDGIELLQKEIGLQALTPAETDRLEEEKKRQLISDAANALVVSRVDAFGMEAELEQISRALANNFGRNLLLVGPNGVGKSALIGEAVRRWGAAGKPGVFWETTASMLIKELTRDTGWQYNLSHLCRELSQSGDWLYVRNFMELFEVGRYAGNEVSMGEFLRTYLGRGEVALISECTEEELQFIDVISPNYSSFFNVIRVFPPDADALESIITSKVEQLAGEKKMTIENGAVREAIVLHRRFNPYSGMPGKVIRFLEAIIREPSVSGNKENKLITKANVIGRFCEESGIPEILLDDAAPLVPEALETHLNRNVFGQAHAASLTTAMLVKEKTRLSRTNKPIASFLFVGPTGVGKTELAKVLAEVVFGNRSRIIRFDMSEFSGYDAIARLTGAGDTDGLLTTTLRREPFCVLLFDEIEKANPAFYDLLLQILDGGRLTDSRGRLVNFCSAIIIMTSNVGAEGTKMRPIGMTNRKDSTDVSAHYKRAVEQFFRPELVNRFDEIIPFNALDADSIRHVVDREIVLLKKREGIRFRRMNFKIDLEVLDYLGARGFNPQYGARYLQRAMREQLVLPLAKALTREDTHDQLEVQVSMDQKLDRPVVDVQADPLSLELLIEELQEANLANFASSCRRHAMQVEDGFLFREILSDWSLLDDYRRALEIDFWKDYERASVYNALSKLKNEQQEQWSSISRLEQEAALAFLGELPGDLNLQQRINDWQNRHFDFKKNLVAYKMPEFNECRMGIYGRELDHIVPRYLALFKLLGIKFHPFGVWMRESYYNEEISIAMDDPALPPIRKKREQYLKEQLKNPLTPLNDRPKAGDQLVGIEFEITGPLVQPLLSGETGFQHWIDKEKTERRFLVLVLPIPQFSTPERIHRLDAFKPSPRRIVSPVLLQDTSYGIEDANGDTELFFGLIFEQLNDNLTRFIDEIVLG